VKDDEDYTPATRPPDTPESGRVRFEREGDYEQSIFGGGAESIERSVFEDTIVNVNLIGSLIYSVETVKDDLGAGPMREISFALKRTGRSGHDCILRIAWTETGLVAAVKG
jgi:hypothetical protein